MFFYQRTKTLDDKCKDIKEQCMDLELSIAAYNSLFSHILDLSEIKDIIKKIDEITLPDTQELQGSIETYKQLKNNNVDLTEAKKLLADISSIIIIDTDELETSINQYKSLVETEKQLSKEIQELRNSLPDVCPYCGAKLDKEVLQCS